MQSIVHRNQAQISAISIDPDLRDKIDKGIKLITEIKQRKGQKIIYLNVRSIYWTHERIAIGF